MGTIEENRRHWQQYGWSRAGEEWPGAWSSVAAEWYGTLLPRVRGLAGRNQTRSSPTTIFIREARDVSTLGSLYHH
jgi:hypothetical protein